MHWTFIGTFNVVKDNEKLTKVFIVAFYQFDYTGGVTWPVLLLLDRHLPNAVANSSNN